MREHSTEELIRKIKSTPLICDESIRPYADADVCVKKFGTDVLSPTTFYLIKSNVELQRVLREVLMREFDINIFNIDRYFEIKTDNGMRSLVPPITHRSDVDGGVVLLEDGAHRVFVARELAEPVTCVYIEGVPTDMPFYAFPNPNGWDDVSLFDDVSQVKQKKKYRVDNKEEEYKLYRLYDAVFPGIGKPRK